ncbi:BolA family protein [Coralliovum pocilloporae]|uniref:BolA family protein n=1 Tax=Coralliovum pocilloporae TaxID=3066369 RepID=UPI003306D05E
MSVKDSIIKKLTDAFAPVELDVIDESDRHKGHGGWREGGETHFRVRIVSEKFRGETRIACHRQVNAVLEAELNDRVHALAIQTSAP